MLQTALVCRSAGEPDALFLHRKITLDFDQSAMDFLCEKGYDPTMGARPVKRAIQNYVENTLARELLAGTVLDGDTIKVRSADGKLIFTK